MEETTSAHIYRCFSQAKGAEIAVYVVIYYILLGVWCLVAFLVMKQKHILRVAQKYANMLVPFLYMDLGIYIIAKSPCHAWSIEHIDHAHSSHPQSHHGSCDNGTPFGMHRRNVMVQTVEKSSSAFLPPC